MKVKLGRLKRSLNAYVTNGISSDTVLVNEPQAGFPLTSETKPFTEWVDWFPLLTVSVKNERAFIYFIFFPPIKDKLTTCFLLLLGLKFQKLGRFQKRFDAHFCPLENTFFRRKGCKADAPVRIACHRERFPV